MSIGLAWAAGFFDGEGCFSLTSRVKRRGKTYQYAYLAVQINQVDREVLDRFAAEVRLGKVRGPYKNKGNGYWAYSVVGDAAVKTLYALLAPHLGSVKREQFDRVLAAQAERRAAWQS